MSALREFKTELDIARREGLPDDAADDAIVEVEAAQREIEKDTPKPERIVKRLENANAIIVAGTGVATATTAAAAAGGKLIPFIESAIQAISKLF